MGVRIHFCLLSHEEWEHRCVKQSQHWCMSTLDTSHKYTYIYIVSIQPHISRPELQKQKWSFAQKKFISMELRMVIKFCRKLQHWNFEDIGKSLRCWSLLWLPRDQYRPCRSRQMRMEVTIRGTSISFRDARRLLPNLYQFPITAFVTARLLLEIDFIKLTTCSSSVDYIFDDPQCTVGN